MTRRPSLPIGPRPRPGSSQQDSLTHTSSPGPEDGLRGPSRLFWAGSPSRIREACIGTQCRRKGRCPESPRKDETTPEAQSLKHRGGTRTPTQETGTPREDAPGGARRSQEGKERVRKRAGRFARSRPCLKLFAAGESANRLPRRPVRVYALEPTSSRRSA